MTRKLKDSMVRLQKNRLTPVREAMAAIAQDAELQRKLELLQRGKGMGCLVLRSPHGLGRS